jgi:hypothetical protein
MFPCADPTSRRIDGSGRGGAHGHKVLCDHHRHNAVHQGETREELQPCLDLVNQSMIHPCVQAEFLLLQDKYKTAVASAAGTIAANIEIVAITEKRRRAGSVNVQTKVRIRVRKREHTHLLKRVTVLADPRQRRRGG